MSNFKRLSPYESHLIAAADEVIRLRGELQSANRWLSGVSVALGAALVGWLL